MVFFFFLFSWLYLFVFIIQRNYKAETEVENWIQKYDQDMGQLQVSSANSIHSSFSYHFL